MLAHNKEEFIRQVEKTWPSHLNHFWEQLCDHFSGDGCKAPSADVHYEFCKDCPCTRKEEVKG